MRRLLAIIALIALTTPVVTSASVDCDGTVNGWASATASADYKFDGNFTLAYHYQLDVVGADQMLTSSNKAGNTASWGNDPYDAAGTTHFYAQYTGGSGDVDVTYTLPTNWRSVVWVKSGTTITLYLNGSSVGTETSNSTTAPNADSPLQLCAYYDGSGRTNGRIARYAIYKGTAWSAGDISAYHTSFGCTIPASPTVSYLFASGLLNTDSSGNGHTLTPNGTGAGWTYSSAEPGVCAAAGAAPADDTQFDIIDSAIPFKTLA